MDAGLVAIQPNTNGFRVIEKDAKYTANSYFINSMNARSLRVWIKTGSNGTDAVVDFDGPHKDRKEGLFALHMYGNEAIFENISTSSKTWVLFVNAQNQLSARETTKDFSKGAKPELDELFVLEKHATSSDFFIKWKKGNKFIGSNKSGQPILLDKVDGDAGKFRAVPAS